jgi:hypothetical protein
MVVDLAPKAHPRLPYYTPLVSGFEDLISSGEAREGSAWRELRGLRG